MKRTYKIKRMIDLSEGPKAHAILETNDKVKFFETLDELITKNEGIEFIKQTTRTAVVAY